MYLILKTLHLLSVVLFLGNIITGLFWKAHGDRTGDPRITAHTLDGIIQSDRWFTVPGVACIVLFGTLGAVVGGLPILSTRWILYSIVLFSVSGIAFAWQVAPLQRELLRLARHAANGATWDAARYRALSVRWEIWGVAALVTPLAAMALMVYKPGA